MFGLRVRKSADAVTMNHVTKLNMRVHEALTNFDKHSVDQMAQALEGAQLHVDSIRDSAINRTGVDGIRGDVERLYNDHLKIYFKAERESLEPTFRVAHTTFQAAAIQKLTDRLGRVKKLTLKDGTIYKFVENFENAVNAVANRRTQLLAFENHYDAAIRNGTPNVASEFTPDAFKTFLGPADGLTDNEKAIHGKAISRICLTSAHLRLMREALGVVERFEAGIRSERGRAYAIEANQVVETLTDAEIELPQNLKLISLSSELRGRVQTAKSAMAANKSAAEQDSEWWDSHGVTNKSATYRKRRDSFEAKVPARVGTASQPNAASRQRPTPQVKPEPPMHFGDREPSPYAGVSASRPSTSAGPNRNSASYGARPNPTADRPSTPYSSGESRSTESAPTRSRPSNTVRREPSQIIGNKALYPPDINPEIASLSRIHQGAAMKDFSMGADGIVYEIRLFTMSLNRQEKHPGTMFKDIIFHGIHGDPIIVFSTDPTGQGSAIPSRSKSRYEPMTREDLRTLIKKFDEMAETGRFATMQPNYLTLMQEFMRTIRAESITRMAT